MALKNEYLQAIEKLNSLPVEEGNRILDKVTENQITPELEDAVLNLQSIPGVGLKTARVILFAIGISLD